MKNSDLIKKLTSLIEALATAILMSEAKAGKIENAVARVNESFELNGEPKPLPTGEYKRRAWLLDDLRRMRLQLIEELRELYTEDEARAEADLFNLGIEGIRRVALYRDTVVNAEVAHAQAIAEDFTRLIEAQRAAGLPVDEEGNDLREWCGNDIEAAHAEALAINGDGDDTPPPAAAAPMRIEQETNDNEFKRGDVHCFTTCGYDCKESVRLELIEHYTQIANEYGLAAEGWHLEVWHSAGWYACLKHDASGFMLCDQHTRGGHKSMRSAEEYQRRQTVDDSRRRWACYNYDTPAGTTQIWVYAATPWQAIGGVIREAQASITGYRGIIVALAPAQCDHAKAANLYGETAPANSYEVHQ
ncbi:MAG: hypothetical protein E7H74_18645 [Escherichia coli]|nr:hypothetical protein [Escherichia coli]